MSVDPEPATTRSPGRPAHEGAPSRRLRGFDHGSGRRAGGARDDTGAVDAPATGAAADRVRERAHVERWRRWEAPAFAYGPLFLLALSLTLHYAVAVPTAVGGPFVPTVTALTAGWILLVRPRQSSRPREDTAETPAAAGSTHGTIYFAGYAVLAFALAASSPLYGFFAWSGYFAVFGVRRRWRWAAILAVSAAAAMSQVGGLIDPTPAALTLYLGVVLVNAAVAGVVISFASLDEIESARRGAALRELEEAHARLQATLEENAGLHAQLVVQAREAGVLDERGRMAREIHDTIAQGLAGIVTQLEAADAEAGPEATRHREAALRLARESLDEARRSVQALRPEPLREARLPDAVAEVAERWGELHGVDAELTTTGEARPLRPEIEVTLLRTVQEALANVARHAEARRVGLTLSYMHDVVTLDVRDDGCGFDPEATARDAADATDGGFGLVAMRQRVRGTGGTFALESEPGGGTAVQATVPALDARDPT